MRKRHERKELTADGVWAAIGSLDRLPLETWPDRPLLRPALGIALDFRLSVYDAVYVALADALDGRVITADRRLVNALAGTRLAPRVGWIGDFA